MKFACLFVRDYKDRHAYIYTTLMNHAKHLDRLTSEIFLYLFASSSHNFVNCINDFYREIPLKYKFIREK